MGELLLSYSAVALWEVDGSAQRVKKLYPIGIVLGGRSAVALPCVPHGVRVLPSLPLKSLTRSTCGHPFPWHNRTTPLTVSRLMVYMRAVAVMFRVRATCCQKRAAFVDSANEGHTDSAIKVCALPFRCLLALCLFTAVGRVCRAAKHVLSDCVDGLLGRKLCFERGLDKSKLIGGGQDL